MIEEQLLPELDTELGVKICKELTEEQLEETLNDLVTENPELSSLLTYLTEQFYIEGNAEKATVYKYSGALTYKLLKEQSKITGKKLPKILEITSDSFCEEQQKDATNCLNIYYKIKKENPKFQGISRVIAIKFIEPTKEILTEEAIELYFIGDRALLLVYGLLSKQAEANKIREEFKF